MSTLIGQPEFDELSATVATLSSTAAAITAVTDDEELAAATNTASSVKRVSKHAEDMRKKLVAPHNDTVKAINAQFAALTSKLSQAEQSIKSLIASYLREKNARIAREQAALEQKFVSASLAGEDVEPPQMVLPQQSVKTADGGAFTTSRWKAEVTDLMSLVKAVAEGRAPLECISANSTFLSAQARSFKKDGVYDGVRFYEDKSISVRS